VGVAGFGGEVARFRLVPIYRWSCNSSLNGLIEAGVHSKYEANDFSGDYYRFQRQRERKNTNHPYSIVLIYYGSPCFFV